MMPEIDGFEVCRRLKANAAVRDIPVIFLTTLQSAGVPADQAGSLADSLIAGRPYTAETTASKVGEVLDKANVDPATIVRVVMSFIGG